MLFKSFLIITCASICIAISLGNALIRNKREAYVLPDGIEEIIGEIKTSFTCNATGYFADQENDCKIFHICFNQEIEGKDEIQQYTFACPNQTMFNQFSLTCGFADESVPCNQSPDFYYLNERIGKQTEQLHTDEDVTKLSNYLSRT